MKMKRFALSALALTGVFAQSSGSTFDAVAITASVPNDGHFSRGCKGGPQSGEPTVWRCTNVTIGILVMRGYSVKRYQLIAPDWVMNSNYEINATLPADTGTEEFREMIRNLLLSRFRLEFHRSKKEMTVYDLVVAREGPRLRESMDDSTGGGPDNPRGAAKEAPTDADGYPNLPKDCRQCLAINGNGKARYRSTRESMSVLADMIGNQLGMPVNDRTGLSGKYDITLSWSSGGGIDRKLDSDAATDPGLTIEAAVEQQLALKLLTKKVLVDVFVVDRADRKPTDN